MRLRTIATIVVCALLGGDAGGDGPTQAPAAPDAARNPIDWSRLRVGSTSARRPHPASPGAFHEWTFDHRRALSALFVSWRIPQTVTGESEEAWFVWFDRKRNSSRVLHLRQHVPTSEGDAWTDAEGRLVVEYPVDDAGGNLRWTERVLFGALGADEPYDVVRTRARPDGAATTPETNRLTPVPRSTASPR